MIDFSKKIAIGLAEKMHYLIFGYEMGREMKEFLGHLSWSFLGGITASAIVAIANVLAGRWLGPAEFGKYGLVVAISNIFVIPMTLGVDTASTYFIAKSKSADEKNRYFNSSLLIVSILIIIVALLFLFFEKIIINLVSINIDLYNVIIVFSVLMAWRSISDSAIKGFHFFRFQSVMRIVEALIVIIFFFVFIRTNGLFNYKAYTFAILAGYIFAILGLLWRLRKRLFICLIHVRKIFSYGKYAILGSVCGILLISSDRILINRFLGAEKLGVYNAYLTFSAIILSQVTVLFINVFFPYMISLEDKGIILKKINRLTAFSFLPILLFLFIILWIAIHLLGHKYKFDWLLTLEFSFLGLLSTYQSAMSWLYNAKSQTGIKFISIHGIIAGLIFVFLMVAFRNILTLYSSVLFLSASFIYLIAVGNLNYNKIK